MKIEDHLIQTGRLYEKNKHIKKLESQSNYKIIKKKSISFNKKEKNSQNTSSISKIIEIKKEKNTLDFSSNITKAKQKVKTSKNYQSLQHKISFKKRKESENVLNGKTISNSRTKLSIMTDHFDMVSTFDVCNKNKKIDLKGNSPLFSLLHKDELIIQDLYNFIYDKSQNLINKAGEKVQSLYN